MQLWHKPWHRVKERSRARAKWRERKAESAKETERATEHKNSVNSFFFVALHACENICAKSMFAHKNDDWLSFRNNVLSCLCEWMFCICWNSFLAFVYLYTWKQWLLFVTTSKSNGQPKIEKKSDKILYNELKLKYVLFALFHSHWNGVSLLFVRPSDQSNTLNGNQSCGIFLRWLFHSLSLVHTFCVCWRNYLHLPLDGWHPMEKRAKQKKRNSVLFIFAALR